MSQRFETGGQRGEAAGDERPGAQPSSPARDLGTEEIGLLASTTVSFKIGDKAVYPSQGIAEIEGIDRREIHGKVQHFYVLRLSESGLRILVPVDKADQVGLRPVAGNEEVDEVLQILKEKHVPLDRHTWNRRYRSFMEKIKSGSLFEVAEVFRDLHRLRRSKALSFGERRMLDTARDLIVQEVSIARRADANAVQQELEQALDEGV
jgi:CarD family transcriptional regulator